MVSDVNFRRCADRDLKFIFNINKMNMQPLVERFRPWDDNLEYQFLKDKVRINDDKIIVYKGKEVGFVSVIDKENQLFLNHLEIHPQYQNLGIGTYVINYYYMQANLLYKPMILHVLKENNRAIRFYEAMGFQVVREFTHPKSKSRKVEMRKL